MNHAVLEADRHESAFYNALIFEHPDYDVFSSAPGKEYMGKVYNIATGDFKTVNNTETVRNL